MPRYSQPNGQVMPSPSKPPVSRMSTGGIASLRPYIPPDGTSTSTHTRGKLKRTQFCCRKAKKNEKKMGEKKKSCAAPPLTRIIGFGWTWYHPPLSAPRNQITHDLPQFHYGVATHHFALLSSFSLLLFVRCCPKNQHSNRLTSNSHTRHDFPPPCPSLPIILSRFSLRARLLLHSHDVH